MTVWSWLRSLVWQEDGPLTRELTLSAGDATLGLLPASRCPDHTTTVVCGYCSTGCGLRIHLREGKPVGLSPDSNYPVNQGKACPKGWEALKALDSRERGTTPLLCNRRGQRQPLDWAQAIDLFVERMRDIQSRHGQDSIAFLSTGQMTTEEMALLGSLTKFGMGLVHGDANTRQCMATAAVAYKKSFGFDAPPFTYADFEASDVIVLVGSNLCIAHPIMWQRIMRNPHQPTIIVIDPRRTETAMAATSHLQIKPKSDAILFYGLAKKLLDWNCLDHEFIERSTVGFDAFRDFLSTVKEGRVLSETGLSAREFEAFAKSIAGGKRVSFWWTMGVNQSHQGVKTAQAMINLALMTGHIGRPGTGANSITGQCNAMGSRIFSNTTSLLGGYEFTKPDHRDKVAHWFRIDPRRVPTHAGLAYDQILEKIEEGHIKALWIVGTNPAHSWIEQGRFSRLLEKLEFLVVQDMYDTTETARCADLFLPAAAWGEKFGTFINSERRIGLVKKIAEPPGLALPDFSIFQRIMKAWGIEEMFEGWDTPEAVFAQLRRFSEGQPCDFTGISSYAHLEESGGIQWPYPAHTASSEKERRIFEDGRFFHPDGKARFLFEEPTPPPERTDQNYPFVLMTGRGSSAQWHTETRTRQSAILMQLQSPEHFVEISAHDAACLGLSTGQWVEVLSRRASIRVRALVSRQIQDGCLFMPMHSALTNLLTASHFDPESRQPSYKHCAVQVRIPEVQA